METNNYEDLVSEIRSQLEADAVLILVVGGTRGDGLAVLGREEVMPKIAKLLRGGADSIGQSNHPFGNNGHNGN